MMEAVDKADAAQLQRERDPRPAGLDPAQLPDGSAHRARPLPRLPDLQLPADDAADRRLPRAQRRARSSQHPTSPSASRSTASTPRRRPSRSAAARRCTAASWCSTSATRRSSTRPTASWSTRCIPQCTVSIHVLWGLRRQNTVFAVGRSIIDRSSTRRHRRADARLRRRRPRGGRAPARSTTSAPRRSSPSSSARSTRPPERGPRRTALRGRAGAPGRMRTWLRSTCRPGYGPACSTWTACSPIPPSCTRGRGRRPSTRCSSAARGRRAPRPSRSGCPRTTTTRSTASRARTACATSSPHAASRSPRATATTRRATETVRAVGNAQERAACWSCSHDRASTSSPARGASWTRPATAGLQDGGGVLQSANTEQTLAAAGLLDLFDERVDGSGHRARAPAGQARTGLLPARAPSCWAWTRARAVFEDALAGVEAGRAGGFGLMVGVDRAGPPRRARQARRRRGGATTWRSCSDERSGTHLPGGALGTSWRSRGGPRPPRPDRSRVFALSNGHIGLRGNLDEGEPAGLSGTYLNGFYESFPLAYGERGYGFAEDGQSRGERHRREGHPPARWRTSRSTCLAARCFGHERAPRLPRRTLQRTLHWRSASGHEVKLRTKRLVSLHRAADRGDRLRDRGGGPARARRPAVEPHRQPRRARGHRRSARPPAASAASSCSRLSVAHGMRVVLGPQHAGQPA